MSSLPHHQLHILQPLRLSPSQVGGVEGRVCHVRVTGKTDINQTFPTLRNNFRLKTPSVHVLQCLSFRWVLFMASAKTQAHETHTQTGTQASTRAGRQTFDKCIDNMTSVRKFTIAFNLIRNCCCYCCCRLGAFVLHFDLWLISLSVAHKFGLFHMPLPLLRSFGNWIRALMSIYTIAGAALHGVCVIFSKYILDNSYWPCWLLI